MHVILLACRQVFGHVTMKLTTDVDQTNVFNVQYVIVVYAWTYWRW